MENNVQNLNTALASLMDAEKVVADQLRSELLRVIRKVGEEINDKCSASELVNYLTDTWCPEPTYRWIDTIEWAANKPSEEGGEIKAFHSYGLTGYHEYRFKHEYMVALAKEVGVKVKK